MAKQGVRLSLSSLSNSNIPLKVRNDVVTNSTKVIDTFKVPVRVLDTSIPGSKGDIVHNLADNNAYYYNGTSWVLFASDSGVSQYQVVVGGPNNTLTTLPPGSAGQVLVSQGPGINPVFSSPSQQSITNVATLRSTAPEYIFHGVNLEGYYNVGDGGGGLFYYDATDTTTPDNGGTVIIASASTSPTARWKRLFTGSVNVRWFGTKGDGVTDDLPAFTAAFTFATAIHAELYVPGGVNSAYGLSASLVITQNSCYVDAGATFPLAGRIMANSDVQTILGTQATAGILYQKTYNQSIGVRAPIVAYAKAMTGSSNAVAILGVAKCAGGAGAYGGKFVSAIDTSATTAVGVEVDIAQNIAGATCSGLVVNSNGSFGPSNHIQLLSSSLAARPTNGIYFNADSGISPVTGSLITATGTSNYGINLSGAIFNTKAIATPGFSVDPSGNVAGLSGTFNTSAGTAKAMVVTGNTSNPAMTIASGSGQHALDITGPLSIGTGTLLATASAPTSVAFGTGVTANNTVGKLTYTVSTAAVTSATSTVTCSSATANSLISLTIQSYSGTMFTNGIPKVSISSTSAGSFVVRLTNLHATNALSGTLVLMYQIWN